MGRDHNRSSNAPEPSRLTNGQRRVLVALTAEWKTAWEIVGDGDVATQTARERAARHANELVKLGLAERSDAYRNPVWRQSAVLRDLVR